MHIESTLNLIRDEFQNGNPKLADGLMQRLQFPLTLGSFKTSLEVGKDYLRRLLSSRMLKDEEDKRIDEIAERFTEGYTDHGFCIGSEELRDMGLVAEEMIEDELSVAWEVHQLNRKRQQLDKEQRRRDIDERLRGLPPELLDLIQSMPATSSGPRALCATTTRRVGADGSYEIAVRLAAALLLKEGAISLADIEALPGIRDRAEATAVAAQLLRVFDAEETSRRIPDSVGAWESIIRLRSSLARRPSVAI